MERSRGTSRTPTATRSSGSTIRKGRPQASDGRLYMTRNHETLHAHAHAGRSSSAFTGVSVLSGSRKSRTHHSVLARLSDSHAVAARNATWDDHRLRDSSPRAAVTLDDRHFELRASVALRRRTAPRTLCVLAPHARISVDTGGY